MGIQTLSNNSTNPSTSTLNQGGQIEADYDSVMVSSNSNITLGSPSLIGGIDGQTIEITNIGNYTITFLDERLNSNSSNLYLAKEENITLSKWETIKLRYCKNAGGKWIQNYLSTDSLSPSGIIGTQLSGLTVANNGITENDTILSAIGKTQGQINNLISIKQDTATLPTAIRNSTLIGLALNSGAISGADSILDAFGKAQGQINLLSNELSSKQDVATLPSSVRSVTLNGLTNLNNSISSSDTILSALGKTQGQISFLGTRIDNLTVATGSFFNGGDTAAGTRKIGNINSGYRFEIINNNATALAVEPTGIVNLWDGTSPRTVGPSNYLKRGTLAIGCNTENYGLGSNWNSNTGAIALECAGQTEMFVHHAGTRAISWLAYEGTPNRVTIGRDMGWGKPEQLFLSAKKTGNIATPSTNFHIHGVGTIPSNLMIEDGFDRPSIAISGIYPTLVISSNLSASAPNNISGSTIKMQASDTSQHWSLGISATNARFFDIGYYYGSSSNPHSGIRNYASSTGFTIIAPNQSQNNAVGNSYSVGINQIEPQYNLEISNGTFAFGINNTRSQIKNDAGANSGLTEKQSGFFYAEVNQIANFYQGAQQGISQLLIDCRLGTSPSYAMQITGAANDQKFYGRKTLGASNTSWREFLMQTSDFISNGWTTNGNKSIDPALNFIGTLDDADLVFRRNNTECLRFETSQIRAKIRTIIGTNPGVTPHNPYGDSIGAPTCYIERLEVGAYAGNASTSAILRFHQNGSGMCEFIKPSGSTLIFRGTPGNNGCDSLDIQTRLFVSNTTASSSSTTGALIISGGVGVAGSIYAGGPIQASEFRVNGQKVVGDRQAALTTSNGSVVDATYGQEEADVINNLRIRLNELESRLRNFGVLN